MKKKWTFLPIVASLSAYSFTWLRADVVAGLTTAAVVIPKSMAFAIIAGLPVEAGLYVALLPMFVYALLGSSRPLSTSSTTTLAILTAAELALVAPGGDPARLLAAASTLALLTGIFLILAGLLRLGFLANFISDPVLTGFKAGAGLVIVVDQLPKLLGVHFDKGSFFQNVFSTPGVNRAGGSQPGRKLLPQLPRGRRNIPDGGKFTGRRPHPNVRAGHGGHRSGDTLLSDAACQPVAAGHAGCCRGRHHDASVEHN